MDNDRSTRVRLLVAGGAIVLAGSITAFALTRGEANGIDQSGTAPLVTLPDVGAGSTVGLDKPVEPDRGSPAATPEEAVERYLDAEIAGDPAISYGTLSVDDLESVGDLADWEAMDDARLPIVGYRIVEQRDGTVLVTAEVTPSVNEDDGVVPGSVVLDIATVAEDGGYRVSLADSVVEAVLPDRAEARPVAINWLEAARACEADRADGFEYDGTLLGTLGLVESLCGVRGTFSAAEAGSLDLLGDPSAVLNAFGEDATDWAEVVELRGLDGGGVQVVLAPLGERWVVVGGFAVT